MISYMMKNNLDDNQFEFGGQTNLKRLIESRVVSNQHENRVAQHFMV